MSINMAENDTCSLQIIRKPENYTGGYYKFGRKSALLEASVEMMVSHAIPLVTVDYTANVWDKYQPNIMNSYASSTPIMLL